MFSVITFIPKLWTKSCFRIPESDFGSAQCYFGENSTLCEHTIAPAIYTVKAGKPPFDGDKRLVL